MRGGERGKERGEVKQEREEGIMNGPVQVVACITEVSLPDTLSFPT